MRGCELVPRRRPGSSNNRGTGPRPSPGDAIHKAWIVLAIAAGLAVPASAGGDEALIAVKKAEAALARSHPREARAALIDAIREDPSFGPAHLLQARVYLQLGDGVAAEAELSRARDAGIAAARTHHLMAHALLLQNQPDRALREADPATVPGAFAAYAARIRGRSLLLLGDNAGAARAFATALRAAPRDAGLWVDLGRFRFAIGESAGALQAADRAVALAPRSPEALLFRGELTRTQYGLRAALPWFERALSIDPLNVPAMLAKAATLGEMGEARATLALTRAVIALDEHNPNAFYLQAVLAARAGKFGLARTLIQRTGNALDQMPAMMLLAGAVEYRLGNMEQAIDRLSRLIAIQPDNMKARRLLGGAQWRAGDVRATIETLQPLGELPEADSYALTLIGRGYERLGDRLTAARYLDRAAQPGWALPPPAGDPHLSEALQRTVAANPANIAAQIDLVRAYVRNGRNEEALNQALALERANPGAAGAHVLVGDVLASLRRFGEAAAAYRQAANMGFTEPVALRLIEALRDAGQNREAAEALSLFLGQNPRNVAGQLLAADFMMSAGEFARAARLLEGLRQRLGDDDAALLNNLAWAWFRTGRTEPAVALAAKAFALAPANPAVAHSYGWLLLQTRRNPARALSLLEQAAAQAPDNPDVRRHLALAGAQRL